MDLHEETYASGLILFLCLTDEWQTAVTVLKNYLSDLQNMHRKYRELYSDDDNGSGFRVNQRLVYITPVHLFPCKFLMFIGISSLWYLV